MATPHIAAEPGMIAETVLVAGDPLRIQFVAENFLDHPVCYSSVRNCYGYTGTYKGVPLSLQAHGMGMPSIGIYSWELYKEFGVENIIRFGTAGSLQEDITLGNIVFSLASSTDSRWQEQYGISGHYAPCCDYSLLKACVDAAEERAIPYIVGNTVAEDVFYNADPGVHAAWEKMGCLCVEMEAAALYMNAAYLRKKAMALFTVTDELKTGRRATTLQREKSCTDMMEIALNAAVSL